MESAALEAHARWRGKIEVTTRAPLNTPGDMTLAYTPGVAEPCLEIARDPSLAYAYTRKWNTVAVVSDGTAVLGLGDIGPLAALPVMEGKAALFKRFGDVDAFPVVLSTKEPDEIIETIERISPSFGGINLEDISAPRCFMIEEALKSRLNIPVFHDDQHGTAIVVAAALGNALRVVEKRIGDIRLVINGAGAAGLAIARLLLKLGVGDIVLCDKQGIISAGDVGANAYQRQMAGITNAGGVKGSLTDALRGADAFVGVSAAGALAAEAVKGMNKDAIVFAMANPVPEIFPDAALAAGARVVGTGRSDFANQINNVMVFPGLFRGALDARAVSVTDAMMMAAVDALGSLVSDGELREDYIIAKPLDPRAPAAVAEAVKQAWARASNPAL